MTISIGEAARRLSVRTSTLRYYEERCLLTPVRRQGGTRRYSEAELRRVAFIQFCQEQGMSLEETRVLLGAGKESWRAAVQHHIDVLTERIAALQRSKAGLEQARDCPAEHPVTECPHLGAMLDQRIAGGSTSGS